MDMAMYEFIGNLLGWAVAVAGGIITIPVHVGSEI